MTTKERQSRLLGVSLCSILFLYGATVMAQDDQTLLAEALLGSNLDDRSSALDMASRINLDDLEPELRMALITAMQQESDMIAERDAAIRRGETRADLDNLMFDTRIARLVASLQDPQAIPALVAGLGGSISIPHALAGFGEQAASSVIAVVMSPQTHPAFRFNHALLALRCMVEFADTSPLLASTMEEMRHAVERRLTTGQPDPTTLRSAIDLAVLLDDPALRQIVENFASDPNAVIARGTERVDRVEETQRLAANRLAGVPALPPCRSEVV